MKPIYRLSNNFVNLLDGHPYYRNIKSYNKEHWFKGIYGTLRECSRTQGPFTELKNKKEELCEYLFQSVSLFPEQKEEVDSWYEISITDLVHKFPNLNIGKSQKLFNILIKYIITSYYYNKHNSPIPNTVNLINNINMVHIPVDRRVLKKYRKSYPESRDFINGNIQLTFNNSKSSWCNLDSYSVYKKFQDKVRDKRVKEKYNSPLELEMDLLWDKQ